MSGQTLCEGPDGRIGAGMDKVKYFQEKRRIFGIDDLGMVGAYCARQWPRETAQALRCASDACENRFLFDFPWDMERTVDPYDFGKKIDWSLIPFGDREFLWQLNRHRFSLCLGQAYAMTGKEAFAEGFVRLFRDWTAQNEYEQEAPDVDLGPWRTLETGIRAVNWIRTLFLLGDSTKIDEEFLELFLKRLLLHGERLAAHFAPHKYQSNWGVLESAGLLLIALALPEGERRQAFLKTASERLGITARLQILGDGVDWEQSPMYHNEVYHSFLTAVYYGERAGIKLPGQVREAVRQMAFADMAWKKPDHTQFAQGDSDATDLRDMLTAGAWLLGEPVLKYGGFPMLDYESAWLFGYGACLSYEKLPSREPEFTSIALSDSGNYYFRTGWEGTANLLHFHCGDMGAAHGHADKLHVDLVLYGEDVLVDSGRYTYVNGEERYALKGARGHNTTLVDGCEFTRIKDSWVCDGLCTSVKRQYRDGFLAAFVEGAHLGYLDRGVWVNRKVIWIKPDIYLIIDEFYPMQDKESDLNKKSHLYEALFHFSAEGRVRERNGLVRFEGKENEAYFQFADGRISLDLQDSVQSPHYNRLSANKTLKASLRAEGFCSMVTVINGGQKGKCTPVSVKRLTPSSAACGRPFADSEAEAFSIKEGARDYVVSIAHREIFSPADAAVIGSCMGYGNVIVFDMADGQEGIRTGEVLSW